MRTPKHLPDPASAPEDGILTVEARTAEEALEELSAKLGPGARILGASKVHRGGVGGFFAREMVQLTARRGEEPSVLTSTPKQRVSNGNGHVHADGSGNGHAHAANGNGHAGNGNGHGNGRRADVFVEALADALGERVAAGGGAVAVGAPEPAQAVRPSPGPARSSRRVGGIGDVAWSPDELVRIGLPFKLIEAASRLRTTDDVSWIQAVAGDVARLCRPMPTAPALVAGPYAAHLARELGLPHVSPDEALTTRGSVVVSTGASGVDPGWLSLALEGRWLHAVIGGEGWEPLADADPLAISWLGADAFVPAVTRAWSAGIVLGYGTCGRRVLRANPVDIAVEIRDRVRRR